jgi:hypothetical protein
MIKKTALAFMLGTVLLPLSARADWWTGVNVSGLVNAGIAMEIVRKVGTIITTIVTTTIDTRSPFENGCVWAWSMIDA